MAKSRVPALGVYQLTSVGLSRRTQPGPGWCCNQAAKQHLLSLRLYSKVLLDVQCCCCPPKTAVAPAPVHLAARFLGLSSRSSHACTCAHHLASPPTSLLAASSPTPSSPRALSFSTVPSNRPVPRRSSSHPAHHHYFQGFLTGSSSGIHRHLVNKRKILVLDVTVATKEVIPPDTLAIGYTRACSHDPRRLRSFP